MLMRENFRKFFSNTHVKGQAVVARRELTGEERKKKYDDIDALFDKHLQKLRERKCPKKIIEMAEEERRSVTIRAAHMDIPEGHIPFVGPIIPPIYVGYHGLMAMLCRGREQADYGCQYRPFDIIDTVEVPKCLYWLYDVDQGASMIGENPIDAERIIKQNMMLPFTIVEAINFCIYTNTLIDGVWGIASRYQGSSHVPVVCLDEEKKRPIIYNHRSGLPYKGARSPSCLYREVPSP